MTEPDTPAPDASEKAVATDAVTPDAVTPDAVTPDASASGPLHAALESPTAPSGLALPKPPVLGSPPAEVAVAANGEVRAPPIIGDKYVVERELARGAMGRIYLATQKGLNRKVAVKVMSPKLGDEDFRRRFMLEATGLANLSHRNIVTVYDYGETAKGMLYLVLEYLEGKTLAQALRIDGAFSVARSCAIGAQLLRGLRAAHKKGIVHRDLKPSNIFLVQTEDGDEEVKVLDFGVAKLFSPDGEVNMADATRDGVLLGTPAFMSPEQIEGQNVGPSTDLYALGVVLYQMTSGRLPFNGKNEVEILFAHLREQPPALRSLEGCAVIPEVVETYVHRLIQKNPSDRFPDATEALEALQQLSGSLMGSDATFRAAVTPQLAQAFMPSGPTNPGSTGAHRPPPPALKTDTGASLMALGPGSSAEMRLPPTSETVEQAALQPPIPAPSALQPPIPAPSSPRRSAAAPIAAVIVGVAVVGALLWKVNADAAEEAFAAPAEVRVVIESIPPGLTLIDDGGRVLGASPVTLATAAAQLVVRARRGDSLSEPVTLQVHEGQLLADFTRALPSPVAPASAVTQPPPSPVERVVSPTRAQPSRPAPRPAPPPAPAVVSPSPAPTSAPTPSTAPRPTFLIEDDRPKVAPLDDRVGIGLLDDDGPKVAPLD